MGSASNNPLAPQVETPQQKQSPRHPSPFDSHSSAEGSGGTIIAGIDVSDFTHDYLYDTLKFCSEAARVQSLRSCELLDSAPEHRFDAITELAACLFDAPVSVVSLVDADRGWFKSRYGPIGPCVKREGTFCSYILVPNFAEVLIFEDCTADARSSGSPYVTGPPQLRYFCACPLVMTREQMRIGTLCVADFKPRHLPSQTYNVLVNLAELVCREVERHPVTQQLAQEAAASGAASAAADSPFAAAAAAAPAADEPVFLVNVEAGPGWEVLYANGAWREILGIPEDAHPPLGEFWDFFEPVGGDMDLEKAKERVLRQGRPATMLLQLRDEVAEVEGQQQLFSVRFLLASRDQLENAVPVSVPAFVAPNQRAAPAPTSTKLSLPLESLWIGTMQPVVVTRDDASPGLSRTSSGSSRLSSSTTFSRRSSAGIGRYPSKPLHLSDLELGPLMGQGSFGRVYRGQLGEKTIAIKVMPMPAAGSEEFESLLKESALCRNLAHPNIVPTLEYFIHHQRHEMWILQHFCDRGSLYDVLDRGMLRQNPSLFSPASLPVVLATALDVASALRYLHDHNVIHGDVTGGNVLLSSADNSRGFVAMVNDFGLSKVNAGEQQMQIFGTISHMPPEMLRDGLLTKATDVYAFGVLLWEMWSGKRAWVGIHPLRLVFMVGDEGAGLEMPADAPAVVKSLAAACLERELSDRPTMGEVVERLEAAIAALPSHENLGASA